MTNSNPTPSSPPASGGAPSGPQKDVPLGPACLVVFIFLLVGLSLIVAYMSFMLTGKQGVRAAYAVREQLIPWVDQSSLSNPDQSIIIERLMEMASQMERDELTSRQLTRLGLRLTDSTILQWGVVEEINRVAQASKGLSEQEKIDFANTCDRWLRAAGEGKLSMTEMEFAFQSAAKKEPRSGRLLLKEPLSDEELREFNRRVLAICDKYKISTEPYEKSVAQVFQLMVDDGLAEK